MKKENKGNLIVGISIIMILIIILILISTLNFSISSNNENNNIIEDDSINYIAEDYKRNIKIISEESVINISNEVINSKIPLNNSEKVIKDHIIGKLNNLNHIYYEKYHITASSEIYSIKNINPFNLEISGKISLKKNAKEYNGNINEKISLIGLKDPLPILKCGNNPNLTIDNENIYYGNSLTNYLNLKETNNTYLYENASSPYIIKKCPYIPYTSHGENGSMKNCISNGYYHESSDGACYLCRLEAKGNCSHYGLETFIIPQSNLSYLQGTCSSDHVIFGDDSYNGNSVIYYLVDNIISEVIYLDNGHLTKYGMG